MKSLLVVYTCSDYQVRLTRRFGTPFFCIWR